MAPCAPAPRAATALTTPRSRAPADRQQQQTPDTRATDPPLSHKPLPAEPLPAINKINTFVVASDLGGKNRWKEEPRTAHQSSAYDQVKFAAGYSTGEANDRGLENGAANPPNYPANEPVTSIDDNAATQPESARSHQHVDQRGRTQRFQRSLGNGGNRAGRKGAAAETRTRSISDDNRRLKPMKLQFYKTKLCPWTCNGAQSCRKGVHCRFAHSPAELRPLPDLSKTKLCESMERTGVCPNPESCSFAHSAEELRATESFAKTKLCPAWQATASCEAGDACRFAHGTAELRKKTSSVSSVPSLPGLRTLPPRSSQPQPRAQTYRAWRSSDSYNPPLPLAPDGAAPRQTSVASSSRSAADCAPQVPQPPPPPPPASYLVPQPAYMMTAAPTSSPHPWIDSGSLQTSNGGFQVFPQYGVWGNAPQSTTQPNSGDDLISSMSPMTLQRVASNALLVLCQQPHQQQQQQQQSGMEAHRPTQASTQSAAFIRHHQVLPVPSVQPLGDFASYGPMWRGSAASQACGPEEKPQQLLLTQVASVSAPGPGESTPTMVTALLPSGIFSPVARDTYFPTAWPQEDNLSSALTPVSRAAYQLQQVASPRTSALLASLIVQRNEPPLETQTEDGGEDCEESHACRNDAVATTLAAASTD